MRFISAMTTSVVCLLFVFSAKAAEPPKPLFASQDAIEIVLDIPLRSISRRDMGETGEVEGRLTLAGQTPSIFDIKVELRGISRQSRDMCSFPPLRLNFRKGQLNDTLFDGQNKLKLVTYCQNRDQYEEYYLKEFLAYRIFNHVTDMSFNVRLARITYNDSDGENESVTRYGFLIEDVDDLAKRHGMDEINIPNTSHRNLDTAQGARVSLFQYLIGNLDWSMNYGPEGENCCHNGKLLQAEGDTDHFYPVAYDFDFSGIVNARYAEPPAGLNVRSVRQRMYRGYCVFNDALPAAIAEFQAARPAITAEITAFSPLEEDERDKVLDYINDFYETIGDTSQTERNIISRCLG